MLRVALLLTIAASLATAAAAAPQDDAVIPACSGPAGLRVVEPGEPCRPAEAPLPWQRGGGAWVHDANGRPLGRAMGPLGAIFVAPGLRIRLRTWDGEIDQGSHLIEFTEPDCTGTALFFWRRAVPGDVLTGHGSPPRLFHTTDRLVEVVSRSRMGPQGCVAFTRRDPCWELEPLTRELGFELPAAAPLRFGAGPIGAVAEEIVHACASASGFVRAVESASDCRNREAPLSWQRLGGLRLYDGAGRDLGAALPLVDPIGVVFSASVLEPASGVWFEAAPLDGRLVLPNLRLGFSEPDCQGTPVLMSAGLSLTGRLWRHPVTQELLVAQGEPVVDASRASSYLFGCSNAPGVMTGHPLVPLEAPLPYTFPLPPPLAVGFPGSPVADPSGEAVDAGSAEACVSGGGRLRLVSRDGSCRASEAPLSWPLRGGLRALDAEGQDLGAFVASPSSNVLGEAMRIVDDASGLRFAVLHTSGQLALLGQDSLHPIAFEAPFCGGRGFLYFYPALGQVFPGFGTRLPPLWVGVSVETLLPRSVLPGCVGPPSFLTVPRPSTVLEPFEGELPFTLPVATPLLLGPGAD